MGVIFNTSSGTAVKAANESTHLHPPQKFDAERYAAYIAFVEGLNIMDASVQIRIVPHTD